MRIKQSLVGLTPTERTRKWREENPKLAKVQLQKAYAKNKKRPGYKERIKKQILVLNNRRKDILNKLKLHVGCQHCPYNLCAPALHFHHIDPKTKQYNISMILSRPKQVMIAELDKCCLFCGNCHAEFHAGLFTDLPAGLGVDLETCLLNW